MNPQSAWFRLVYVLLMVGALVKHEQNLVDISKDARDNEGRTR